MRTDTVHARPEGDLGRYLDQARRQPMLDAIEEQGLARRWRDRRDPEPPGRGDGPGPEHERRGEVHDVGPVLLERRAHRGRRDPDR